MRSGGLTLCGIDKIAVLAMTVTLKLKPEVEAGLLRQARTRMTLEEYLPGHEYSAPQ